MPHTTKSLGRTLAPVGIIAFASALAAVPASAGNNSLSFEEALSSGTVSLNSRLRYEGVNQQGIADDAAAFTFRTRLGYTTSVWQHWQGLIEYEGVAALGGRAYAPETAGRPVVADPAGSELNRWWLRYSGIPKTTVTIGRQRSLLNNSRVVGNVGWRQNEQTFDGVTLVNNSFADTTITAAYFNNSNFITFTNKPMKTGLLNVTNSSIKGLTLSAYALTLDFDETAADTQTLGLRLAGTQPFAGGKLLYEAEYAQQSDFSENPQDFSESYIHLMLGFNTGPLTFKVGHEVLDGNGRQSVQFPLSTLHKFNGWADKFLATPANGLVDNYLGVWAKVDGYTFAVIWHDFSAAQSGVADYGKELNLLAIKPINKRLKVVAKYADYNSKGFATDTEKFWLQLDYAF